MDRTKWLTIEELAEALKMGRTELYRRAQDGPSQVQMATSNGTSTWRGFITV